MNAILVTPWHEVNRYQESQDTFSEISQAPQGRLLHIILVSRGALNIQSYRSGEKGRPRLSQRASIAVQDHAPLATDVITLISEMKEF
jgi:hypothetical protein